MQLHRYSIYAIILLIIISSVSIANTIDNTEYYTRHVTIRGYGISSSYASPNQPYYYSTDLVDNSVCIPSIYSIDNSIYYTRNIINDTMIIDLGMGTILLFVLKGINSTSTSFDIYMLDLYREESIYLGNLSRYNISFPRLLRGVTMYYYAYNLGNNRFIVVVYVVSEKGLVANLIYLAMHKNNSISLLGLRRVSNAIYYKPLVKYGKFLLIRQKLGEGLYFDIGDNPLLTGENTTLYLKTSWQKFFMIQFISSKLNGSILWINIPYIYCRAYLADYVSKIYLVGLNITGNRFEFIGEYSDIGEEDLPSRYSIPVVFNDSVYISTMNRIFAYNESSRNNLTIILKDNDILPACTIPYIDSTIGTVYSVRSKFNRSVGCITPSNITLRSLRDHSINAVFNINMESYDEEYDLPGFSIKNIGGNRSFLIIPFYKYSKAFGVIQYGLLYVLIDNNLNGSARSVKLYLGNIYVWSLPEATTTLETEIYDIDYDRDGYPETLSVVKYYLLNNTYVYEIYLIDEYSPPIVYVLPEPPITALLFILIMLLTMYYKHRGITKTTHK